MLIGLFACLPLASVQAGSLTLEFDTSFGNPLDPDTAPPDGTGPWLTAVFDDGGLAGSVTLTLTVGDIGLGDVGSVYLNLDPIVDPTSLTFAVIGGTGPAAATGSYDPPPGLLANGFQADGDGLYDIWFEFPPPPGNQAARFNANETLIYTITDTTNTLIANSFNFLSAPSLDPNSTKGPFLAAAKVLDTGSSTVPCVGGDGECSDWIAPPSAVIPVPASVWLFGSALGLLGWMRRKVH